jgi:hypothetical protein
VVFVNQGLPGYDKEQIIMAKKAHKKTVHRSSKTGRFVTEKYAKKHPNTTEKERVNTGK